MYIGWITFVHVRISNARMGSDRPNYMLDKLHVLIYYFEVLHKYELVSLDLLYVHFSRIYNVSRRLVIDLLLQWYGRMDLSNNLLYRGVNCQLPDRQLTAATVHCHDH